MDILKDRFCVFASTLQEAKYITSKQKEICGDNDSPLDKRYYRFCAADRDKYGSSESNYLESGNFWDLKFMLTCEEFKKHFPKENNGTIVGYKVPYNLSVSNWKKGDIAIKGKSDKDYWVENKFGRIPQEIVETWEPVYKPKETIIKMGNAFDLTVKDGKVFHGNEDITEFVINLVNHYDKLDFPKGFGIYEACVKISFTKTGCKKDTTTLEEWRSVYNELKKQK